MFIYAMISQRQCISSARRRNLIFEISTLRNIGIKSIEMFNDDSHARDSYTKDNTQQEKKLVYIKRIDTDFPRPKDILFCNSPNQAHLCNIWIL